MHRLHASLHALVVLMLAAGPAHAREEPRAIQAIRVASDVVEIDGRADEPAWKFAVVAGRFTQRDPEEGVEPTEPTLVRVAFDDRALYVFIQARDSRPPRDPPLSHTEGHREPIGLARSLAKSLERQANGLPIRRQRARRALISQSGLTLSLPGTRTHGRRTFSVVPVEMLASN